VISLTSTVLNEVDCSSAPLSFCESLNRERCELIVGTCGECLSGFLGLSGPSNTQCMSLERMTSTGNRLLSVQFSNPDHPSTNTISSVICSSDIDCLDEGLFLECNMQSKLCQSIQQSCPNTCSGHGRCGFVSKYDANVSVSECGVLDEDCVPRCDCEAGYVGLSCWLTDEEASIEMEVRHLNLERVSQLMSRENADTSNVQSWMKTLSLVGSDYSRNRSGVTDQEVESPIKVLPTINTDHVGAHISIPDLPLRDSRPIIHHRNSKERYQLE
jgi:hypothetical protein